MSSYRDKNVETREPLVTVVVPSFNHGQFIEKAICSVLTQDFTDFELLISDDASVDSSWEVIKRFGDSRLRAFRQEKNLGPVGNLVFLIKKARGKYVALLNSDDHWLAGKLTKQVAVMERDPKLGACFTWADLVDESGSVVTGIDGLWRDPFRQRNRSQAEWLRHFFFNGNCICHPSMLIRRVIYDELGFYNSGLRQLPDFEMWIRLVKKYPIWIVEENLVGHLRTGMNTSAVTPETVARNITESVEILEGFFNDIPDELFIAGFGAGFRLQGVPLTPEELHCEKLFLLMEGGFLEIAGKAAAIRGFYQCFRQPEVEDLLSSAYQFSVSDFYRLTETSGLGYHWLLANKAIWPSFLQFLLAARLHWGGHWLYKCLKEIGHRSGLIRRKDRS